MEEEIVEVINIKTDASITTVKDLKKYISELRDDLVKLNKGTEEYDKTLEALISSEKKLTEVMSAGKNEIKAAAGSYNALQQEMTALRKVWKETTDEATRNQIGQRIAEINTQLKDMDASIGNFQRNVGNYKSALDALNGTYSNQREELAALKKALDQLDPSTKEYEQAFNRAAEITHNLADRQERLKYASADLGDQLSNIRGIATNMVAGFSAVNAAMGLFGEESEDVQKAMLKVQQSIALVQGLEGLDGFIKRTEGLSKAMKTWVTESKAVTTATKAQTTAQNAQTVATEGTTVAQKGLNAAIKANPIGAIITAITILVALFAKFKTQIVNFLGGAEKLNAAFAKMKAAILGVVNVIGKQLLVPIKEAINIFKTLGTVITDVFTGNWGKIGDDIKEGFNNSLNIIEDGYNVIENYNEAHNASMEKSNTKASRKAAEARTKELEDVIATNNAKYDSDWKYTESGKTLYEEYLQAKIDSYKKDSKEYKAAVNDKLKYDREFAEKQQKQADEAAKKEKEQREKAQKAAEEARKKQETIEKNYQTQIQKNYGVGLRETINTYKEELKTLEDYYTIQLKTTTDPNISKQLKKSISIIKKELKSVNDMDVFSLENMIIGNGNVEKGLSKTFERIQKVYNAKLKDVIDNGEQEAAKRANDALVKIFEQTIQPYINQELTKIQNETDKQTVILDYNIDYGDFSKKQETELEKVKVKYDALDQSLQVQLEYYEQIRDFVNNNNLTPSDEYDIAIQKIDELTIKQTQAEDNRRKEIAAIQTNYFNIALEQTQAETEALVKSVEDTFKQSSIKEGWDEMFSPISPEEEQKYLDDIYNVQLNGLTKVRDLWQQRANDETLTNEERVEAKRNLAQAEMDISDLILEHDVQVYEQRKEQVLMYVDIVKESVNQISSLFGSLADIYEENINAQVKANKMSEKEADLQFEKVKGLRIAEATINTIAGSIGAFMQASATYPAPYGQILGGITAAAVTAAGIAQIQKIAHSERSGSGSGSAASVQAPQINEMPVQYVQNVTNESDIDNLRNAVTEGMSSVNLSVSVTDIDSAQTKVKTRENESSF